MISTSAPSGAKGGEAGLAVGLGLALEPVPVV
jgi:hypothetical protein